MRHGKKFNHLGRSAAHRSAMLANMASSLIEHKRINTTVAKAKALKRYVEPLITKSKDDNTHSRRVVFSYLQNKNAVSELFREVADKVGDRPGGYTRIIKTGKRLGDNAEMCMIELVDFNEIYTNEKETRKAKTRRSRRGGGGGARKTESSAPKPAEAAADKQEESATEAKQEAPKEEAAAETKPQEAKAETAAEEPAESKKKEEASGDSEEKEAEASADDKKQQESKEADEEEKKD